MSILQLPVLDKGHVALFRSSPAWDGPVDIDRAIAQYARGSTHSVGGLLTEYTNLKTIDKDHSLARWLLRQDPKHVSPMEQITITWHFKAPIVVMRELQRHWSFRWSEMSGRHQEYPDEFYIPREWRRAGTVKNRQTSGTEAHRLSDEYRLSVERHFLTSYSLYEGMLRDNIERGQARIVLPMGALYTEGFGTASLRDVLVSLIPQRDHQDAFWETRQYAVAMKRIMYTVAPVACTELFGSNPFEPVMPSDDWGAHECV